jgi:hypothetical protein
MADADDGLQYTHDDIPYLEVDAAREYSVFTVIPYSDDPEYREYMPDGEELPKLLAELQDPQIAETVLTVEPHY